MAKTTIPRNRVVTQEFTNALTALCRAKGLDVKHAWPLADAKRLAADEAKRFEEARNDAIARHGIGEATVTPQANKNFVMEINAILAAPVEFSIEAGAISIADGALTGDVLEQVMEFVKRPE